MRYPKIDTLWKRDKETHQIIPDECSKKEFRSIQYWEVTEKIDGTNIVIEYMKGLPGEDNRITISGRTEEAQIPVKLNDFFKKKVLI